MLTKSIKANLDAILAQYALGDTVASLARSAYKYTDCGASVGARINDDWVYGSDLHKIGPDDVVTALSVSSIVEGVDQTTDTHVIELSKFATPDVAVKAYSAALDAVEKEASEIWHQTHGCPTCAKHWGGYGDFGPIEGNDGHTPIWEQCPDCGGHGSVI